MPATKIRTALRTTGLVWDEFFKAATDMSAACALYKWVQPGSVFGEVALATGASLGAPLGVLQNNPPAGCIARVRVMGKSITVASMNACSLLPGTWVAVGSAAQSFPTTCGIANARWAGSITSSASGASWGGYGEVYLLGPSFNACIAGAS